MSRTSESSILLPPLNVFSVKLEKNWPSLKSKVPTQVWVIGKPSAPDYKKYLKNEVQSWEWQDFLNSSADLVKLAGSNGAIWVARRTSMSDNSSSQKELQVSDYSHFRDIAGQWVRQMDSTGKQREVAIYFVGCSAEICRGFLLGMQVAAYRFKKFSQPEKKIQQRIAVYGRSSKVNEEDIKWSDRLARSVNFARHLVNLPAQDFSPEAYVKLTKSLFAKDPSFHLDVWNPVRLKKEKMGLMLGVGQGADSGPYMIHLKYRPKGAKKQPPVAFVGKGITFDTGGLDVKPAPAMRLMKKDMGGSAAVLGLALWSQLSRVKMNLDFYLAVAENAISAKAFRPGDILKSRKGLSVEVHNTDAEGRLVLADVLTVAHEAKGKDKPGVVIDIATLTGAIKVTLGSYVGGLFTNNEILTKNLMKAAQGMGDYLWPMPLDFHQNDRLNSTVADLVNCTDGFGGAVTAALFLEKFVESDCWAHLDIYAWTDSTRGALSETGGSGQGVQCLANYLESMT